MVKNVAQKIREPTKKIIKFYNFKVPVFNSASYDITCSTQTNRVINVINGIVSKSTVAVPKNG